MKNLIFNNNIIANQSIKKSILTLLPLLPLLFLLDHSYFVPYLPFPSHHFLHFLPFFLPVFFLGTLWGDWGNILQSCPKHPKTPHRGYGRPYLRIWPWEKKRNIMDMWNCFGIHPFFKNHVYKNVEAQIYNRTVIIIYLNLLSRNFLNLFSTSFPISWTISSTSFLISRLIYSLLISSFSCFSSPVFPISSPEFTSFFATCWFLQNVRAASADCKIFWFCH